MEFYLPCRVNGNEVEFFTGITFKGKKLYGKTGVKLKDIELTPIMAVTKAGFPSVSMLGQQLKTKED